MSERECRTFEKKLAHFTAPTLLGIKCASLVSLSREEFDIPAYAAAFNAQAVRGGLQMQIMCRCQKRQLVLLYRPKLLQKRLEQPEIRRFLNYYLPTTLKLVTAYREFSEQPVQGSNIQNAKNTIKQTLDTVNDAFAKLLDGLYQDDVLDISSDASVLETMFAQEGLTGGDFEKK